MSAGEAVRVCVRVRPMNSREKERKAKLIVEMKNNQTWLKNPEAPDDIKKFTYDHSYWSFNDKDPHYASQDTLFDDVGKDVIDSCFDGFNACVFAYGQTGAGKSYSMTGYGEAVGLIPRISEGIFDRVGHSPDDTEFSAKVSYLEIYNEKVRDLLRVDPKAKGKEPVYQNLRVREHPQTGPYVEGLTAHDVSNYPQIEKLMEGGNANRITAATAMNATSSRSHAIFTLLFTQASFVAGVPSEKISKINLVDLAGSERSSSTGATGARLKEGANINKSLTTLGLVISALADASQSDHGKKKKKGKGHFIPYRDSMLTYLLKDSLGGNSKTIMIAAISPADINYGETLSTLHYANRAKNIVNKAIVNEDPNVKMIKDLQAEVARLKELMGGDEVVAKMQQQADEAKAALEAATTPEERATAQAAVAQAEAKLENTTKAQGEKAELMRMQLKQQEALMGQLTSQWQDKWSQQSKILEDRGLEVKESGRGLVVGSELPHLVSLSLDDPLATGIVIFHLHEGKTTVGKANEGGAPAEVEAADAQDDAEGSRAETPAPAPGPDIELQGVGVQENHCVLEFDGSELVTLHASCDHCYINGKKVEKDTSVELMTGTTLQFGGGNIFRFNNPAQAAKLRELRKQGSDFSLSESGTPMGADYYTTPGQMEQERKETEERIQAAQKKLEQLELDKSALEEQRDAEAIQLRQEMEQREAEQQKLAEKLAEAEAKAAERDLEVKQLREQEAKRLEELRLQQEEAEKAVLEQGELAALEAQRHLEMEKAAILEDQRKEKEAELAKWQAEIKAMELAAQEAADKAMAEAAARAAAVQEAEMISTAKAEELAAAREEAERQAAAAAAERARRDQVEQAALAEAEAAKQARLEAEEREKKLAAKARREVEVLQSKLKATEMTFHDIWQITVPKVHTRGDPSSSSKSYVVFEVRVSLHGESWKVFRRYREFVAFRDEMKKLMPTIIGPIAFPPKKLWPDSKFLKQRRADLEEYLNKVIEKTHLLPDSPFFRADRSKLMKEVPFFRPGEGLLKKD
eukprot:m.484753 g.484753  ORF g.484753 m.484753 type:complete len:1036 (+) comp23533_c0_seq1:198-3305(+)